jgi:hypothetical protein
MNRKLFVQLRACATLGQVSYILYKKKKKNSDEVRRRIVKTRHIHSIPLYTPSGCTDNSDGMVYNIYNIL